MALGVEMLASAGVEPESQRAREKLEGVRRDGTALELFARVVEAQGGDPRVVEAPDRVLPSAPLRSEVAALESGFVTGVDALRVGVAAMRLGAGRERKEDTIDPGVGISVLVKPGSRIEPGQPLFRLAYRHPARLNEALRVLEGAVEVGDQAPEPAAPILERIA
jgi:thymidine phosphorylase